MTSKKHLLLLLIFLFVGISTGQQKNKGIITGVIIDSISQKPIEMVNIILKSKDDSTFNSGAATDKAGRFILEGINSGSYFLTISVIGYQSEVVDNISITTKSTSLDLKKIKLTKKSVELGEVTALGERPDVEYHLDKKVINVEKSIYATSGNTLEVLQNQPSVQTDSEGNIKLRGSTNFKLQINGRPSVLSGSDGLRQIPANLVSKIEIITNPSAKYEAEGSAGIINILTKQVEQSDLSGIINIGVTAEKEIQITDKFALPVNVSVITNPQQQNIFFVLGISL